MPADLNQAFRLAAAELGMASAAWLFVDQVAEAGGAQAVTALRDELGRTWPVLDAVCVARLAGHRAARVDITDVVRELDGATRVVVVGIEASWLDALVAALPASTRVALVRHSSLAPDWGRVRANHGGRVELVGLDDYQAWAGPRSALLTFVYGEGGGQAFVLPAWVRTSGPDVRTQFRSLIGWEVLRVPLSVYPRWLVAVDADEFTHIAARATSG